jgi:hypothetical protein
VIETTSKGSDDRARLEAILVAALVENEDWRVLTELALCAGHGALAQRFAQALADERRHLARVRAWPLDSDPPVAKARRRA